MNPGYLMLATRLKGSCSQIAEERARSRLSPKPCTCVAAGGRCPCPGAEAARPAVACILSATWFRGSRGLTALGHGIKGPTGAQPLASCGLVSPQPRRAAPAAELSAAATAGLQGLGRTAKPYAGIPAQRMAYRASWCPPAAHSSHRRQLRAGQFCAANACLGAASAGSCTDPGVTGSVSCDPCANCSPEREMVVFSPCFITIASQSKYVFGALVSKLRSFMLFIVAWHDLP